MNRSQQVSAGKRRGSTLVEAAMWLPVLIAMLFGMIELARVTYTYYTVHKILYSLARYVGTQSGINLCDGTDANLVAAKNLALRGSPDEAAEPILADLDPDSIQIRLERRNAETGELDECECTDSGCDAATGGVAPQWIVVSLTGGYPVQLAIPRLTLDPIPLRPVVRVPYGGI
jgi:hypothetical protein